LLVESIPGETSLLDLARIEVGLEDLLKVAVHVVTAPELPRRAREQILAEAQPV
jgi:predicted nucleotidyltransferase